MAILIFFDMRQTGIISRFLDKPFSRDSVLIGIGLLVSIIIGTTVFLFTKNYYEASAEQRFETEAKENADAMKRRIEKYENALRSGVAFFQADSDGVTRDEWHRFIRTLQPENFYSGVQGIGYAIMLKPEAVPTVDQMHREGHPSFALKPAGNREVYSSILYLEPMDRRNAQAIGYDMYSDPIRRLAMDKAADTGLAVISGKVKLVQEIDSDMQAGFLMYLPFYKTGEKTDTLEERRKALAGFVYSPFRMKELVQSLNVNDASFNYEIYDGEISDENLFFRFAESSKSVSNYQHDEIIHIGGRVWHVRYSSTHKFDTTNASGRHIFLSLSIFLVYILLMLIIFKLIYNRKILKQQRDELQKEKETAQNYLDIVDVIMLVCDVHLKVQLINRYGCEVIGYRADEVIGQNWVEKFLSASNQNEANAIAKRLLSLDEYSISYENAIVTKSGEERLIAWRIRILLDKENSITGFLCSGEDVTEIRKAQLQLNESEEFYRTIFSSVSEAIVILHEDVIVDCNHLALHFFEMKKEEVIGKSILGPEHTIECRKGSFYSYLDAAYRGEFSTTECTLTSEKKGFETKILELTLSSLGSQDEHKIILIARDIGRRVEQERLLKMHTRQAQMGEMISVIAHQWRQPLAIINAITSQMRLKLMMTEDADPLMTEKLMMIEDQSSHLSQTISEYRDFFHPNKPKEHFQLSTVLQNAINLVDYALKNHSIELEIVVKEDPILFSYRNEVLQVLIALLKNALDAFEDKVIKHKKILIRIDKDGEYGNITILDNAGGIPAEILEKIFLPYFTTKDQDSGTGIGLHMSKMIIEGHCRGSIQASNNGEYAVFTIKLPLESKE